MKSGLRQSPSSDRSSGLGRALQFGYGFWHHRSFTPVGIGHDGLAAFWWWHANIGASHDASLPFPFPTLEIMGPDGNWEPLEVVTGAPAGKTKTMIVDLADRLPYDACRIRCSMAFEIHWDRIQLMEAVDEANTLVHAVSPATSDLHWRGFSRYQEGPWTQPSPPTTIRCALTLPG